MKPLGRPPYICLITRGDANSGNYESEKPKILESIRDAIESGVNLIQIREKMLPARMLFNLVTDAVRVASGTDSLIVVNDRADIAMTAGADGVHLPENSIPAQVVRAAISRELVIGVSTHSIEKAKSAPAAGADYVFFGPVFETPGKGDPTGLASLELVCNELGDFPVIALGGVDQSNLGEIFGTGAAGVAAIRALSTRESTRNFMNALGTLNIR